MNLLGSFLLDVDSVVQIQVTHRPAMFVKSDDQTPWVQPRGLCGVAGLLDRHNVATSDVDRLVQERRLQSLVLARRCLDFFVSVPIVPSGAFCDTREDTLYRSRQWSKNWCHEKCGPRHELSLDSGQLRVVREFPCQRAEDSLSSLMRFMEERVCVWN